MLEVIERSSLVNEHMDEVVAVVHENPSGVIEPFDLDRSGTASRFDSKLYLISDSSDLSRIAAAGDHKRIGDSEHLAHRQNDRVLT